jgi:hypothetical protein
MAAWSSMRSERARIDRRLTVVPAAALPADSGAVITFRDEWGAAVQVFDLAVLGLSGEITTVLADAFRTHYAGSAVATRKGCWKALRAFPLRSRGRRDSRSRRSRH